MNGDFFPLKAALSDYMKRFYALVYPDTPALAEFVERGLDRSVVWAPDRMVDAAEEMLKAYQKNSNTDPLVPGKNALFPIIIVGMAKDYIPAGPDQGGRQVGRRLVSLVEGGSIYGYRQAMGEIRTQIVIMCAESASARSLASQFGLWIGEIQNRRFSVNHTFGQYTVVMPCMLEMPDVVFSAVQSDNSNMTILAADITLKTVTPYFDYPRGGADNDGSSNNPPGYPSVQVVNSMNHTGSVLSITSESGTIWPEVSATPPAQMVVLNDYTFLVAPA